MTESIRRLGLQLGQKKLNKLSLGRAKMVKIAALEAHDGWHRHVASLYSHGSSTLHCMK